MNAILNTLKRSLLSTKFLAMAGAVITLASQGMYEEMAGVIMAWLIAQGVADHGKATQKPAGVDHNGRS